MKHYIQKHILPMYDHFDAAHQQTHAEMVINQSLEIAKYYDVNRDMVYAIAAYHDTGLSVDRATHHLESGKIVRNDQRLREWFTEEQIELMAQAVEDHRASSDHEPRSIYGKIVAEADRFIEPETIIRRTVQYGLDHYPDLDRQGHIQRAMEHIKAKYGDGGYLRLWFPNSPNAARLETLRIIIRNEEQLRATIDKYLL